MVLVWVLFALVELLLYLPLLSGAFLAYAQLSGTDAMPAAAWWRDVGNAIGALTDLSPANLSTFMTVWLGLALVMLIGRPLWTMLRAFTGR